MISFHTVVTSLKASADELTTVNTVGFGTISMLDADQQNAAYPYVFFRPLTSPGINFGQPMIGGRTLNFEMYVMDIPLLTDTDMTTVMSNTEQIGYNVITKYYDGVYEPLYTVSVGSIVPLFEAFQDRIGGWVFNISVETDNQGITSCNRT